MRNFRLLPLCFVLSAGLSSAADVTGNWLIAKDRKDGTVARTWFNLRQDGASVSGHIRTPQAYLTITRSSGNGGVLSITAGSSYFEAKLVGEELYVGERRGGADSPLLEVGVAHRAAPEDGSLPPRIDLPALRELTNNGLVKTPPMGWSGQDPGSESVDEALVRAIADAMISNA